MRLYQNVMKILKSALVNVTIKKYLQTSDPRKFFFAKSIIRYLRGSFNREQLFIAPNADWAYEANLKSLKKSSTPLRSALS